MNALPTNQLTDRPTDQQTQPGFVALKKKYNGTKENINICKLFFTINIQTQLQVFKYLGRGSDALKSRQCQHSYQWTDKLIYGPID